MLSFPIMDTQQQTLTFQGKLWQQAKCWEPDRKRIVIPVTYGGDSGPVLGSVATYHALTRAQLIALHSRVE